MAAGNQRKHLELTLARSKRLLIFILSVKLGNIRVDTFLNILVTRYFRVRNTLPRDNADVTHCEKTVFYFQNKGVYRVEERPADVCLKMTLPENIKF